MSKLEVTIGADPEFFVVDNEKNKIGSAEGLLGGSKLRPKKLGCGFVQEDNVLGEFNIPPAKGAGDFRASVENMMNDIGNLLDKQNHSMAANLAIHKYPEEDAEQYLTTSHANTFGCDPDFNAWDMDENPDTSVMAKESNVRVAGGHIHIGIPQNRFGPMTTAHLTKLCDLLISFPLIYRMPKPLQKQEVKRRIFYGCAGSHRIKPYGIEYRAVSNVWLWNSELIEFVYHQAHLAAHLACQDNTRAEDIIRRIEEYNLKEILNNYDNFEVGGPEIGMTKEIAADHTAAFNVKTGMFSPRGQTPKYINYDFSGMGNKKSTTKKAQQKVMSETEITSSGGWRIISTGWGG